MSSVDASEDMVGLAWVVTAVGGGAASARACATEDTPSLSLSRGVDAASSAGEAAGPVAGGGFLALFFFRGMSPCLA